MSSRRFRGRRPDSEGLTAPSRSDPNQVINRTRRGGAAVCRPCKRKIESAACVIALWSPASVTHDGLLAVAESARRRNVLLPVVIAPVTIPFPFDQLRTFPLVSWYRSADDSGFLQLTERIKRFVADWRNRDAATPSLGAVAQPSTPRARGSGLFLCYRRDDTQDAAGRLHDRLVEAYRAERVFMDIDSVSLGIDFVEHVTEQIGKCSAVIVMIGRLMGGRHRQRRTPRRLRSTATLFCE
jgi:hypothetical protein